MNDKSKLLQARGTIMKMQRIIDLYHSPTFSELDAKFILEQVEKIIEEDKSGWKEFFEYEPLPYSPAFGCGECGSKENISYGMTLCDDCSIKENK